MESSPPGYFQGRILVDICNRCPPVSIGPQNQNNQDAGGTAFALPAALRTSPRDSAAVRYNVSLVANSLTANGYVLQAVPVDAADACGTYTLDQTGTRLNTVGANPAAYLRNCWER